MVVNTPFLLNIESATGVCSICISKGEKILSFQKSEAEYEHSKILTTLIAKCLYESGLKLLEIDAVALSSGPGSYTSLRVGASTAKGICYALNKPLISVDTLQSLALGAQTELDLENAYYCPMIDARRMEVYCNLFDQKNQPLRNAEAIVVNSGSFDEVFAEGKKVVFCGNGAEKCKDLFSSSQAVFYPSSCSAFYMPSLSNKQFLKEEFVDVAYHTPFYLKSPNITIPKNVKL